jgi:hypothetical protein
VTLTSAYSSLGYLLSKDEVKVLIREEVRKEWLAPMRMNTVEEPSRS